MVRIQGSYGLGKGEMSSLLVGLPDDSDSKESACNVGPPGSVPYLEVKFSISFNCESRHQDSRILGCYFVVHRNLKYFYHTTIVAWDSRISFTLISTLKLVIFRPIMRLFVLIKEPHALLYHDLPS